METQISDFEIADIITLELVNESAFMHYIQPYVKEAVNNYSKTAALRSAIGTFQDNSTCCAAHTYALLEQSPNVNKIVAVEVLKHYWEQYSDEKFDIRTHIPSDFCATYKGKEEKTRAFKKASKRDDQLGALRCKPYERRFMHKFMKLKGDSTMSQEIKISNLTLINGQDATELDNDDIFNLIARTEKQITRLEEIKTKPKALEAKIKDLQKGIEGLVAIVDARA